jgi:tetratricopeptide (TPR) repeat protein
MDYTELFDLYIDGRLTGKELEEFEQALENDPDLKNDLEKFKALHIAAEKTIRQDKPEEEEYEIDKETDELSRDDISKYGKEKRDQSDTDMVHFEEMLKNAERDHLNERGGRFKKTMFIWYGAAAIVFIILAVSVFLIVRTNKLNTLDLYATFFEPYVKSEKVFELTRSSDDFYYAVKVFEAGDYSRAAILFSNLSDSVELKAYALFYSGITSMELGKWDEAISSLKNAIGCGEDQIAYDSRWYLGLCYLRVDDEESARRQFEILASEKNEYTRKSRQIVRILNRRR